MYRHLTAIINIYTPCWLVELCTTSSCICSKLPRAFYTQLSKNRGFCQLTKNCRSLNFLDGIVEVWLAEAWENFGTSRKLFELAMSSCWQIFCKTKQKICIVRTGPKLYTCVTLQLLYKGTTGEQIFQNYHI